MSAVNINLRFRSAGTDNTASTYQFTESYTAGGAYTSSRSLATNTIRLTPNIGAVAALYGLELYNPNAAADTQLFSNSPFTGAVLFMSVGGFSGSTVFDGFTLYPASGTITGTIQVFGYKD